jgi:hypothetical protein
MSARQKTELAHVGTGLIKQPRLVIITTPLLLLFGHDDDRFFHGRASPAKGLSPPQIRPLLPFSALLFMPEIYCADIT